MIADTNLLVRAVQDDDALQSRAARHALSSADQVVISQHAFCEMVWVLRQHYKMPKTKIIEAIRGYLEAGKVIADTAAVQAGLEAMKAGADFADGVIAYEGRWLGGEEFVSFDRKAVAAMEKQGVSARLLR
ncbi:MAG TPA: type II toxin-antitoxin system VapC family toxin [Terracidiphilus sp.]|nr:type II toxin-antitoxin system VapC family toxin [Terracidiphilus sp.]